MSEKRVLLFLLIVFVLASCSHPISSIEMPPTLQETPTPLDFLTLTTTPSVSQREEKIIWEINVCANKYQDLVESEKQENNYETVTLPDGKEGINFLGDARLKITDAFVETQKCIQQLNLEYTQLYKATHETYSIPAEPLAQRSRLTDLLASLDGWMENERKNGNVIEIYSPYTLGPILFLTGDSYARSVIIEDEIKSLQLALAGISNEDVQLDAEAIKKIDDGNVSLLGVSAFPYYRSDIKLTSYETGSCYYIIYSAQHVIIEIIPKEIPQTADLTPVAFLSAQMLEQRARALIATIAPNVNLDTLTAVPGSKIGSFFFRWEDRTKPVLDDGMTYPFVQVGLNGNGELLNYYDTLPLAR
jgi:hypothetical protein